MNKFTKVGVIIFMIATALSLWYMNEQIPLLIGALFFLSILLMFVGIDDWVEISGDDNGKAH